MSTKDNILKVLSKIIDPDVNRDIVSLGFVKDVTVKDGHVSLTIELTTPACPIKAKFQQEATHLVSQLPGVKSVDVRMTSQSAPRRGEEKGLQGSPLQKVARIIAVSSCKGGVGKSTMAACLAKELSRRGFLIGLLDCDLYGPSVPMLFNMQKPDIFTNEDKQLLPVEAEGLKLMSFGFVLGDAPAVMRGPMVSAYVQQLLRGVDWGKLDYLFIDLPPGTGDIQLTITQSVQLDGAVIVTTPHTLSLVDVGRGILMFEKVNVPILGIIENMAYFECDNCKTQHFIFGEGGTKIEERFGIPILARLPISPTLAHNISQIEGTPPIRDAVDKMVMALGKSRLQRRSIPEIFFDDTTTTINWPDGETISLNNYYLRMNCRCALCVDEITGEKKIHEQDIPADVKPTEITPLGNYAVGISWSDGHTSSIYPYQYLRQLKERLS